MRIYICKLSENYMNYRVGYLSQIIKIKNNSCKIKNNKKFEKMQLKFKEYVYIDVCVLKTNNIS